MTLGERIKDARKKKGLTQLELARKLGWRNSVFVSAFERGLSRVPLRVVNKCCDILEMDKRKVVNDLISEYSDHVKGVIK